MGLHHSEETHQMLLARIPGATGRPVQEWLGHLEQGPGLLRFEERVNWFSRSISVASHRWPPDCRRIAVVRRQARQRLGPKHGRPDRR